MWHGAQVVRVKTVTVMSFLSEGTRPPYPWKEWGEENISALQFLTGVKFLYYSENFGLRRRLTVGSGTFL